ncbi:MAG: response regulator transcription factor [Flavobacteriales bacterium]|jgi:two-component system invasion response regulator UvrY|tara:strand:- start:1089 stop:1748 length:660 start_codon:yes stop_codon:yes gene_type:complete
MKSVIICDDHPIVREGLKLLIQGFGKYEVLADVESGEALMKRLKRGTADIVILDVSLPGSSGLEVLKSLKALYGRVKVLILSMYPEDQFALRMIKAGASGYLHKDSSPEILQEALDKIATGEEYLSNSLAKILLGVVNGKSTAQASHELLSDREFQVFLYIGEGLSLSNIGVKLNLSVKTISTYKSRIYEKMNMENTSEIVRYIMVKNLGVQTSLKQTT